MERSSPDLTERQRQILAAVCRDYVASGEPVSSRRLIESHGFNWSSATLRSELAALVRLGLLVQPHHSSGRLPTAAGLQRYVDQLPVAADPPPGLARAVDRTLSEVEPAAVARLGAAATILSAATDCVAVSLLGRENACRTRHVEVVPLVEGRALVVLGMDDGTTRVQAVTVEDDPLAADPADALRAKLRWLFVGRTLSQVRARLVELLRREEERVDRMLGQAFSVGMGLCTAESLRPSWVVVTGQPQLARRLESSAGGTLAPLLELLEDYHRLAELLSRVVPGPEVDLRARVRVGLPGRETRGTEGDGPLSVWSVIGCRLPGVVRAGEPSESGAIALVGPNRMDFAVLIPLVEYAARALATQGA